MSALGKAWLGLGRHRARSVVALGLIGFAAAALLSALRTPVPRIHDEFSYLLAADTFASGRLSNPTHPYWVHFETFHVIHEPSYASKYPPLQGVSLGVGSLLGHPIVGAWLTTALAVAACVWMFQGWLPSRWACVGGVLVAFHHGVQIHWGQTYWGGAIPMLGGALVFGAWPRLLRHPQPRNGVWLAIGAALLAGSRPFEGVVVCLPVALSLARAWLRSEDRAERFDWLRALTPTALFLVAVGAAAAGYNHRVTGDPWTLPYQIHEQTYSDTPMFVWQSRREAPPYRHDVIRDFYQGWVRDAHRQQRDPWMAVKARASILPFFFTPLLAATLVASPWIFRSRRLRAAGGICVWAIAATFLLAWVPRSHYIAPVASLMFVIAVQGMRHIWLWQPLGRRIGPALVGALVLGHLLLFGLSCEAYRHADVPGWALKRDEIRRLLLDTGGRHLVLVEYGDHHSVHEEWVANGADLEAAPILWARPLDPKSTAGLRAHYRDRQVWTLHVEPNAVTLEPFEEPIEWDGWPR